MTDKNKKQEMENVTEEVAGEKVQHDQPEANKMGHEPEKTFRKLKRDKTAELIKELKETIALKDDRYLRLQAEFDNYRKRTLKEKMDLTKTGGESVLIKIIPVIDDFERALKLMGNDHDEGAILEGINLIYKRFNDFLQQNGVKEIEAINLALDTDLHEAITKIPAQTDEMKGKIVDVIQKGYLLNDKVIRFAKVVIGE